MATVFSIMFFALAVSLVILAIEALTDGLFTDHHLVEGLLKAINMAIISLAMFELGLVVNKEYADKADKGDVVVVLRRTVPRFVSIVCIALALEGLLMVIKYSQLELAGNLYYPVAIITSAAFLLIALGVFLHFSRAATQTELNHAEHPVISSAPPQADVLNPTLGDPPTSIDPVPVNAS